MSESSNNIETEEFKQNSKTFEYRVWDSSVVLSEADLEASFGEGCQERRTDVYLPLVENYLPKFRGKQRLELKERIDRIDGVETWKRSVSVGFPVTERDLARFQSCVPNLKLSPETFRKAEQALSYFQERLDLLSVKKNRTLYKIDIQGSCAAEIELTAVSVGGRSHKTLAIESSDHQSALNLISELELDRFDNISYADWIRKQAE